MKHSKYEISEQYISSVCKKRDKLLLKRNRIKAYIEILEEEFAKDKNYSYDHNSVVSECMRQLENIEYKLKKIKILLDLQFLIYNKMAERRK